MNCYRVRQFIRALTARVSEEELEEVAQVVSPAAYELFCSMAVQDQRHSLDVYTTLRLSGWHHPDLLTAALLHDVGKSLAPLPAWQRALIVLLSRFVPCLLERLGRGELRGWRRGFVVHAHHAELGASLAQRAGCSPLASSLIGRHHEDGQQAAEDVLLAALQAADCAN
ncbi:MAG: HD domain-containing protein [Anaerolineae bacterium]|nr:HD domain-containing protein [Anaerolineae bacterium]